MLFISDYFFTIKIGTTISNRIMIFTNSFFSAQILSSPADDREENGVPAAILSLSSQLKGPYCDISTYYREGNGTYPRFLPYRLKKEERDGRKKGRKGWKGTEERKKGTERNGRTDGRKKTGSREIWSPSYVFIRAGI